MHIFTDVKDSRNTPFVWEAAQWGWVSERRQGLAKNQAAFFKFQKESLRVGGLENGPGQWELYLGGGEEHGQFFISFFSRKKRAASRKEPGINVGWGWRGWQLLSQSIGRLFITRYQKISWANAGTMLISNLKCISSYWGEQSPSRSLPSSPTALMAPSYAQHHV